MVVSLFGLVTALLSGTILLLILHLFWKPLNQTLGFSKLLALYLLCAARMWFPVEILASPIPEIPVVQHFSRGDGSFWLYGVFFLWGCPAVVLLAVFWARYLRGVSNLSKISCSCPIAEEVLSHIQKEQSGPRSIQVLSCPGVKIPLGMGLFRKRIVLSQRDYSQEELSYILQHEYTHFCNGDLWIKFITCVFCCVFWWNPVAYLFRKDLAQLMELRCDQSVTCGLSTEGKTAYLSVLLNAVKQSGRKTWTLNTVGIPLFSGHSSQGMVERFQAVMAKPEAVKTWRKVLASVLILGTVTTSLFLVESSGMAEFQSVTATMDESRAREIESIWMFDTPEGIIQLPEWQVREWLDSHGYHEYELKTNE